MSMIEEHEDVLQNIEAAVIQVWRQHPDMTNYTAARAYEAAIAHYHAIEREQTPKPVTLTGLDLTVFEGVKGICELRLGKKRLADEPEFPALRIEDLVACLRKLKKSVDFWTKQGGRQGYMKHVEQFVP